jgi:hypothetical protein
MRRDPRRELMQRSGLAVAAPTLDGLESAAPWIPLPGISPRLCLNQCHSGQSEGIDIDCLPIWSRLQTPTHPGLPARGGALTKKRFPVSHRDQPSEGLGPAEVVEGLKAERTKRHPS